MRASEGLRWLYETQWHGIKLGLETVHRLLKALGVEPSGAIYFHVAGTNGKGSVCAMLEAICQRAGLRTALYTSPHLVNFRERIRINGTLISETALEAGLAQIRHLSAGWQPAPTFFEIATALALAFFQQEGAEVIILETGMGGRLDATNAIDPTVSIITPIDLDHQQWLGDHLAAIATEKAGIIKPGRPVISAPQKTEAAAVLSQIARERNAPLTFVKHPATLPLGLAGSHQQWNAALALEALASSPLKIAPEIIASGLREVQWPGRFQILDGKIVLDGAHNCAAAMRLSETWREIFGQTKPTVILGMMQDKDQRGICNALAPWAARVLTVRVQNDRAASAEDLRALWLSLSPNSACSPCLSLRQALETAASFESPILITGSLFLIGEALVELGLAPGEQERSTQ